jgi:hypothetical protein
MTTKLSLNQPGLSSDPSTSVPTAWSLNHKVVPQPVAGVKAHTAYTMPPSEVDLAWLWGVWESLSENDRKAAYAFFGGIHRRRIEVSWHTLATLGKDGKGVPRS